MVPPSSVLAVRGLREPSAGVAEVVVALGEDLFAGHFPGHPTLSAVGQLAVVEAALAAWRGDGARLAAVERMRLTRRVEGGEVAVRLEEGGNGEVRFALTAAGEGVSAGKGAVGERWTGGEAPAGRKVGRFGGDEERPLPTLPHAGAARMLSRVLAARGDTIVAEAVLSAASPFAGLAREAGAAPAWVAIEMAAQAAAALELAGRDGDDGPRLGYLVRLRDVRCRRSTLPVGEPVRLEVTRGAAISTLRTYGIFASLDGAALVAGELSVFFVPPAS